MVIVVPILVLAEPILFALFAIFALPFGLVVAMGIASGSDKWESEDQIQYEHFNPHVKLVRKVDRKQPTPLQTPDPAVIRWERESLERLQSSDTIHRETKLVHSVMEKQVHYCREDQSQDEALRIMREHGLQYLPVVDSNLRIIGVVRRHY